MNEEKENKGLRNILLVIAYDGTEYLGWQTQAKGITIQKTIEDCLAKILQEKVKLIGSGRTDRGVHALRQAANFITYSKLETTSIQRGLNSLLPKDIIVKEAKEVDINFHARFHAKKKSYIYQIWNDRTFSPFFRRYSWWIPQPLDLGKMRAASLLLIGKQDLSSFKAQDKKIKDPTRKILSLTIESKRYPLVALTIEADSFLKHMVRNIVGTLVDVGIGKIDKEKFREILMAKDRNKAGITAPPQGLFLKTVTY